MLRCVTAAVTGASRPFITRSMGAPGLAPQVLMPVGARVDLCQGAAYMQHVKLNTCSSRRRVHAEGMISGMHLRKRLGRSALVRVLLHGPLQVCMSARHTLQSAFMYYKPDMLMEMTAHDFLHGTNWAHVCTSVQPPQALRNRHMIRLRTRAWAA